MKVRKGLVSGVRKGLVSEVRVDEGGWKVYNWFSFGAIAKCVN